ncbi:hypothetical protein OC846_004935 [Tilletia horrida]|uniref:Uncharacterized protein n=1 Tax=Tilletia horrida TaxID=155126 RepID=A0AAN6GLE2_9BASI|nr:hypothetical protein OC846_004935 [Tilletia horrida]KAK0564605.1 hypothetical protein OC861_004195 [Tilletia horrida]
MARIKASQLRISTSRKAPRKQLGRRHDPPGRKDTGVGSRLTPADLPNVKIEDVSEEDGQDKVTSSDEESVAEKPAKLHVSSSTRDDIIEEGPSETRDELVSIRMHRSRGVSSKHESKSKKDEGDHSLKISDGDSDSKNEQEQEQEQPQRKRPRGIRLTLDPSNVSSSQGLPTLRIEDGEAAPTHVQNGEQESRLTTLELRAAQQTVTSIKASLEVVSSQVELLKTQLRALEPRLNMLPSDSTAAPTSRGGTQD